MANTPGPYICIEMTNLFKASMRLARSQNEMDWDLFWCDKVATLFT